ncbi:methyltransferase domain-containing protein [uncultured Brevundimonas sp.]|uniref:class I SAM-dependent methyltransferase n=1 Tax=uncultured Brevundimonas sp. TaxID=213418 RepID=UPI002592713A|nr:methyltransferase domain-containing protein [uncultured Brevundimonas sp.]
MSAAPARPFDWNGSNGDRWVANQARLDRMLRPFGEALLAVAAPAIGERVLDVGFGAGASAFDCAGAVGPSGQVLGLDVSEALVALAERRAATLDLPVAFRLADAATFEPEAGFDRIVSRFGVMFFPEPEAAFANLLQAVGPGGRLVFVCWRAAGENDWTRLPMTAIRDIVPPPPPPDREAPGPFSFGDAARVERILRQAGWTDIRLTPFDHPILFGEGDTAEDAVEDAVDLAVQVGPLSRALADQPEPVRQEALNAVRQAFARKVAPEGVVIDGAAWIVTAQRA